MEPTGQDGTTGRRGPIEPQDQGVPRRARRGAPAPTGSVGAGEQGARGAVRGGRSARRAQPEEVVPAQPETPEPPVRPSSPPQRADAEETASESPARVRTVAGVAALRAVGFAVLALAVGIACALVPRQQRELSDAAGIVPGQTLVCPPSQQAAWLTAASTSPSLRISGLDGTGSDVKVPASLSIGTSGGLVRSANGQGRPTATTMSVVGRGAAATSTWSNCATASTGGTVIVADPSSSDIQVTNPESEDASVDVSLSGAKGAISVTGTRGIIVPANSSKVLPLSVWVSGRSPVAATLSTDTGRVVAVARTRGTAGAATIAMSSPAQNLWIPAVPAGSTGAEMLVFNPTSSRATAKVTALAAGGPFIPEGADQIEIEPHATIAVDLSKALAAEAVGLSVSANVAVGAQLMATKGKDISMVTPGAAATSLQSVLPRGGTLSLSNPSDQPARIEGTYRELSGRAIGFTALLPSGMTWTRNLGASGGHLVVTADHAIIGGVWYSQEGLSSVPMSVVSGPVRSSQIVVDPQLS